MDRETPAPRPRIGSLILWPALITLAVTLLRLIGEINRWSPRFFSREAGGAGALVGIVWLVPLFGIYFAVKLCRAGRGPAGRGRAMGHALLGLAVAVGLMVLALRLPVGPPLRIVLANLASLAGVAVAFRGWPELGKTAAAYGLAARVPVAALMLIAMLAEWGTHYELGPPGFPKMGVFATWFYVGLLPQLMLWIAYTVIVSLILGSLAAFVVQAGAPAPAKAG
jgi:hypothetical protein